MGANNGGQSRRTADRKCANCQAVCCHNLSVRVLKPRTKKEMDDLRWHLYYDTVKIYIVNNRWHLLINGKCIHLGQDNLCRIYERRPHRCRKHSPPNCEKYGEFYDAVLSTPDEFDDYLKKSRCA